MRWRRFRQRICLFPNVTDGDEMASIVTSPRRRPARVQFPLSLVKLQGREELYYEVISSLAFPSATAPSRRSWAVFSWNVSRRLWAEMPISRCHRAFYRHMIQARYHGILESSAGYRSEGEVSVRESVTAAQLCLDGRGGFLPTWWR